MCTPWFGWYLQPPGFRFLWQPWKKNVHALFTKHRKAMDRKRNSKGCMVLFETMSCPNTCLAMSQAAWLICSGVNRQPSSIPREKWIKLGFWSSDNILIRWASPSVDPYVKVWVTSPPARANSRASWRTAPGCSQAASGVYLPEIFTFSPSSFSFPLFLTVSQYSCDHNNYHCLQAASGVVVNDTLVF